MTAAVSHSPEPYEVPDGGLASFLTATVGDWSDEALNADNYYDVVKPTADQLAAFGREEDDRIAHVATGETVIPMAVFEEDPALKEALFSRMREMGIDPEHYVVGNELNSINPVTGQPEFFLKKIFKGIKKAVKGVVKVFKKVAPIVLSIAGGMMLGPIGAALGSGIGTLIQGGNLKDAFRSALISGVTAGVAQGVNQGFEAAGSAAKVAEEGGKALTLTERLTAGIEGFGQSIGEGLGLVEGTSYLDQLSGAQGIMNPTGRETPAEIVDKSVAMERVIPAEGMTPAQIKANAAGTATKSPTDFMIEQNIARRRALESAVQGSGGSAPTMSVADKAAQLAKGPTSAQLAQLDAPTLTGASSLTDPTSQLIRNKQMQDAIIAGQPAPDVTAQTLQELADQGIGTAPSAGGSATTTGATISGVGDITTAVREAADPGFFASMKKFFMERDLDALKQAFLPGTKPEVIKAKLEAAGFNVTPEVVKEIAEELAPTAFRRYGPLAAAGLGIMGLTGGFEQPEMEELPDMYGGITGMDLLRANPGKYGLAQPGEAYRPPGAATGGDIQNFPRRNGPIYGPGTETSDDIPAMLSDGEFVMTAKAVRGAGNGSREAGMRKMYNMMSQFERAV